MDRDLYTLAFGDKTPDEHSLKWQLFVMAKGQYPNCIRQTAAAALRRIVELERKEQ